MIRVLIVDDSPLIRRLLGGIFDAEGDFEVAFARDGQEALALLPAWKPDVVTLDVQMPNMDGLACLDRIMLEHPCPVVMVSSLTEAGADTTLEALDLGAVDYVPKPGGAISLKIEALAPLLVEKVRAAASARLPKSKRLRDRVRLRTGLDRPPPRPVAPSRPSGSGAGASSPAPGDGIVLVGASTGGPPALDALLMPLPASFPWPIVIAQHMPATFTGSLARRLDKLCAMPVSEVVGPTPLLPGHVYIGRGDADIILSARGTGTIALSAPSSPDYRWHPSVDRLVESAMAHREAARIVGILMTGMGNDGARSMTRLRAAGGRTLAEAEETAVVWGMPGELVKAGGAEIVAPLDRIAARLMDMVPSR
ncbi:protein-glutamate methylesterase/protein-glutamine glutaminase [Microvirga pudoricolor]|uniref:protein-glutamate methylesterase/protein-glutamine glutaminase n=1 Tax=Microvirga pudoricolor TaxID=2778729 RepID=UPI001952829A|nr:chemotaxis response regulator protein-glutamate methylesterase [Microvirga pudoricolor]MBM6595233.1 chemotaxis response regulator protein-glutamate methylesterase [Microvirga pudoricolor]